MARGVGVTDNSCQASQARSDLAPAKARHVTPDMKERQQKSPSIPRATAPTVRLRAAQSMTETKELRPVSVE